MSTLSREEKRQINNERSSAVRESLAREKAYVAEGRGTRDWTEQQQQDILEGNRPCDENGKAFEGHHMKSVSAHPEHAGNASNIQWLSRDEHIQGAHKGTGHNATNGYYNPQTKETESLEGRPPKAPDAHDLSKPVSKGPEQGHGHENVSEAKGVSR